MDRTEDIAGIQMLEILVPANNFYSFIFTINYVIVKFENDHGVKFLPGFYFCFQLQQSISVGCSNNELL